MTMAVLGPGSGSPRIGFVLEGAGRILCVKGESEAVAFQGSASQASPLLQERKLFLACYKSAAAGSGELGLLHKAVRLSVHSLLFPFILGDGAGLTGGSVPGHFCSLHCSRVIFGDWGIGSCDRGFHSGALFD